jgi:hypothetical protein
MMRMLQFDTDGRAGEGKESWDTNMTSWANPLYLLGSRAEAAVSRLKTREESLAPEEMVARSMLTRPLKTCERVIFTTLYRFILFSAVEDLRARVFAVAWMVVVQRWDPVVFNAQDEVALARGWGGEIRNKTETKPL